MRLKDQKAGRRGMLRIVLGAEVRVGERKFTFVINCDAYGSKKA